MSDAPENTTVGDTGIAPVTVGLVDLDPIADVEAKVTKNRSKVGGIRPSALLYTSGIGATVDLPHLSVMPHGIDAWQRYYDRRPGAPTPSWSPGFSIWSGRTSATR